MDENQGLGLCQNVGGLASLLLMNSGVGIKKHGIN